MTCNCRTPKHLTNNEKNIETHFAYDDDFDYGHINATHLDINIFFAKPNGINDHLIDYVMNITLQGFSAWANGLAHFFLISFNIFILNTT